VGLGGGADPVDLGQQLRLEPARGLVLAGRAAGGEKCVDLVEK
jgi:hypothetical protein